MTEIHMRAKHQVTLPHSVVRQANIKLDDKLTASYVNGSIVLTPATMGKNQTDIMAFAGIAECLWGNTAEEIDQTLNRTKSVW